MSPLLNVSVFASMLLLATGGGAPPTYGVVARYPVGGEGGWDYLAVDSASHRLFVSRGTHVMVLSTDSGEVVGDIPDTEGVHGIALVPKLGRGFTSNGRANTVTVFDLKSLKTLGTIAVGQNPDAILYDVVSGRLVTCNGRSSDLTVIDAAAEKVVGTIKLSGKPETPVADGRTIFVNIEDKSTIERVDLKGMKALGTWSVGPGEEPSGLALDARRHVLFAVCSNGKMVVMDDRNGKILATPKIGDGPDAAGYDPARDLAFSSNGEGTVSVVKRDAAGVYSTVETVTTAPTARTMALDERTHCLYLSSATPLPATASGGRRQMVPGSFTILVVGPTGK